MYINKSRPEISGNKRRRFFKSRPLRVAFISCVFLCSTLSICAQRVALHTNTIDWLTLSPNLGVEFSLNSRLSLDFSAAGNPFKVRDDMYLRQARIQSELKYWFTGILTCHYMGVTAGYGAFDFGLRSRGFYGDAYAAGLTYGYSWILSRRWNMEISTGIGALYYRMARYTPGTPHPQPNESGWTIAPVKLAFSFIYVLK